MSQTAINPKLSQAGYPVRADADFFTPPWVVQDCLIPLVPMATHILEPAVGNGNIKAVLEAYGHTVIGIDINPDPAVDLQMNFLDYTNPDNIPFDIVGNFPYFTPHNIDIKFIKHALALTKPHGGKVAALFPMQYDFGKTRKDVFELCKEAKYQIKLTRRISWSNVKPKRDKDGKRVSPTKNHVWYIWEHGNSAGSTNLYAPVPNAPQHPDIETYAQFEERMEAWV